MKQFLAIVRKACSSSVFSSGVELSRRDVITGESEDDDEVVLRVAASPHAPAHTVVLYPSDEEWDCDCGTRAAICVHVVASAIAVVRAREQGLRLPTSSAVGGVVVYRFSRADMGLALTRAIRGGQDIETELTTTLQAHLASGSTDVSASQMDLQVDRLLGSRVRGRLDDTRLGQLFKILEGCDNVFLQETAVTVSTDSVLPFAVLEDDGAAVRLRVTRDPAIDEVVASRVVRVGNSLHLLAHTEISGRMLEHLPHEEHFSPAQFAELKTVRVPRLRETTRLTVTSRRLPGLDTTLVPRLAIELEERGGVVTVLATLVYGNPPQARIHAGKLMHLQGDMPLRDIEAEQRLLHRLRDELDLLPGRRQSYAGADAAVFATKLDRFRGVERGQLRGAELLDAPTLRGAVSTQGRRLEVAFHLPGPNTGEAKAKHVFDAWRGGVDLVPLIGGGFGRIPSAWLEKYGERVSALLDARKSDGNLPAHASPAVATLFDDLDEPRPDFADSLAPLIDGFDGLPHAVLPADLHATLRPYQQAGIDWLCYLRDNELGGVLADDMGLGKTLQAIASARGRALVVCPRSVVHNWRDEIARFRHGVSVAVYHGAARSLENLADITLTTYGLLRLDADALGSVEWDCVFLDEAQAIKNPDSQTARAARRLRANFRVAMTGTPVENRLDELWSLLEFCNPGMLGARTIFRDRVARPIADGDADAAENLGKTLRPFVLRRLKRDVLPELPPRTDAVLHVELDAEERAVYDAIRAATRQQIAQMLSGGSGVMAALEALLRLRQAACHPSLVPGQKAESSSKLRRLVSALSEAAADSHKSLVFSQWTSVLDLIEPALTTAGLDFVRLDGATRDRAAAVARFQSQDGPPVMLISLKAGGTGLNLTAADHVFLFDPWWNPAVEDQAADRAHRIGQDNPVIVYRLVADNTVEERILALQEHKRRVAEAALTGTAAAASLTRDDLLDLLAES